MNLRRIHGVFLALLIAVLVISLLSERVALKKNIPGAEYDQLIPSADVEVPIPQPAEPSSNDSYSVRAAQLLREVMSQVSQIRNETLGEVKLEVVTKAWVIENWGKSYSNQVRSLQRQDRVYRGFFMTSEGETLYQAQVEWAAGFVAAELKGKIYVVRENFDPFNEVKAKSTLAHELTHIIQEQNRKIPKTSSTFDGEKARDALIEGDATFMSEFFNNVTFTRVSSSAAIQNGQFYPILFGNPLLSQIHFSLPQSFSSLSYFPYKYGLEFVRALHDKGGWETVNQAYVNPPTTTEQILHPEKYFAGEAGVKVVLPKMTDSSWTRVGNETYGEYFLVVMLEKWIPQGEAERAAAGWGGDTLVSYEKGNDSLLAWNITWDSAVDATEFDAAFHKMTKATGAVEENGVWCCDINGRFMSVRTEGQSTLILTSTNATGVLAPLGNLTRLGNT